MFERVVAYDNLHSAYKQSLKSDGKFKIASIKFSYDYVTNLEEKSEKVTRGAYRPDGYNEFTVYEPKIRQVHSPKYPDKIVQLALVNELRKIYQPNFIDTSYACLEDKGTHKAVEELEGYIYEAYKKWGDSSFIIKIDIRKFFYSIDRDILKKIIRKRIFCRETLELLDIILDSSPDELGLPLGNVVSQILANVYMNEVDQYCKRVLGIKYYIRYMDDVTIILPSREEARVVLGKIISYLNTELNLEANKDKTKLFPIKQGVNTIGFRIYHTHILLREDSKKRVKRKIKKLPRLINDGRMTVEKAEQMLNSWLGHSNYSCNWNLISSILEKNEYLTLDKKGVFKICL